MFESDGMITATRFTRFEARAPAILLGTYPSSFAAASTRVRVASDTSPRFRSTRLTVISETPDASDTSRRVRGRFVICCHLGTCAVFDLPDASANTAIGSTA